MNALNLHGIEAIDVEMHPLDPDTGEKLGWCYVTLVDDEGRQFQVTAFSSYGIDDEGTEVALTGDAIDRLVQQQRKAETACDELRAQLVNREAELCRVVELLNRLDDEAPGALQIDERAILEHMNRILASIREGQTELAV